MMVKSLNRVYSIDIFRAVTMFLMIFVNDLEGVPGVPGWLKHAGESVDGLGLADIIFPAFLFIVGLSIPYSIINRKKRGDDTYSIALYIVSRSFALILIGFIHANMEIYSKEAYLSKPVWDILTTISFFLIWLSYPPQLAKHWRTALQVTGIVLLVLMCILYRADLNSKTSWLTFTWWGILGLIGWAYLLCSLIYLFAGNNLWVMAAAWMFFLFFNLDFHFGWLGFLNGMQTYVGLSGNGAMQAFTASGVVISMMYSMLSRSKNFGLVWGALFMMAFIMFNLGFIVRYFSGGISKANDTPSWVMICTGINIVAYSIFMFVVDMRKKQSWFEVIKPAGTSTLTCYLLTFLFYPLYQLTNLGYPDAWTHGTGGLIKCLAFALFIVWVAGLLGKKDIRLKI
jgi:predicted acyltransferase